MKGVERGTREDFETVSRQIGVESVAKYLGLQKDGKLYKYPNENLRWLCERAHGWKDYK